jgi:hypothetical protein
MAKSAPRRSPKDLQSVGEWFDAQIPGWFVGPVAVAADRDELVVTGNLAIPEGLGALIPYQRAAVLIAHIDAFRERTRTERMQLAASAQIQLQRQVSWTVQCGEVEKPFTNLSTPIMTRLRFEERQVLDSLVDASIARSRSEALAWCVRLVGQHEDDWLTELRDALVKVEQVRSKGPEA